MGSIKTCHADLEGTLGRSSHTTESMTTNPQTHPGWLLRILHTWLLRAPILLQVSIFSGCWVWNLLSKGKVTVMLTWSYSGENFVMQPELDTNLSSATYILGHLGSLHPSSIRNWRMEILPGTSWAVQWLRFRLPTQGVCVWSLVGEFRFHMPCGKKTKT